VNVDELRTVPLFAGASAQGLEQLASRAGEMECEVGQVLALRGDPGSGMFVIQEGSVVVEWRGGSVELGPGDFFGELTLLAPHAKRVARVRATTPVRCLAIARDDALALVESEPTIALAMLREVARRFASVLPDS